MASVGVGAMERMVSTVKALLPAFLEMRYVAEAMVVALAQAFGTDLPKVGGAVWSEMLRRLAKESLMWSSVVEAMFKNWPLMLYDAVLRMERAWHILMLGIVSAVRDLLDALPTWLGGGKYAPIDRAFAYEMRAILDLTNAIDANTRSIAKQAIGIFTQRMEEFKKLMEPSARPGAGGAGAAQYKTVQGNELALAGSERAYEILFANQATQEQLMTAQLSAQDAALQQLQQINNQLMNHPVVIGPI
jgi:hypothetical protein